MLYKLLFIPLLFFMYPLASDEDGNKRYRITEYGPVIDWRPDVRLNWNDFKAREKKGGGFAVAASTCGFGYDGIDKGGDISINVYVRFYCLESWNNDNFQLPDVLAHEQLHFDICELYGRKFYREVLDLRRKNKLTPKSLEKKLNQMIEEYDNFQNRYDAETNHSTNITKQAEWYRHIKRELYLTTPYANYKEY